MRKAFRHTGVLMMLAVVALGLVGAAYTLWYEKLTAVTDVQTASLNVDWSFHPWSGSTNASVEGNFNTPNSPTGGAGKPVVAVPTVSTLNGGVATYLGTSGSGANSNLFTYANFHPSWMSVGVDKTKPTCNATVNQGNSTTAASITYTMTGLYPYAGCEFKFDVSNTGTVPVHLGILKVEQQMYNGNQWVNVTGNLPWTRGVVQADSSDYNKCLAFMNAEWASAQARPGQINDGTNPVQIENGQDLACAFMLVLDENWKIDDSSLGTPGSFISNENVHLKVTVTYVAYQWNETPNASAWSSLQTSGPTN